MRSLKYILVFCFASFNAILPALAEPHATKTMPICTPFATVAETLNQDYVEMGGKGLLFRLSGKKALDAIKFASLQGWITHETFSVDILIIDTFNEKDLVRIAFYDTTCNGVRWVLLANAEAFKGLKEAVKGHEIPDITHS